MLNWEFPSTPTNIIYPNTPKSDNQTSNSNKPHHYFKNTEQKLKNLENNYSQLKMRIENIEDNYLMNDEKICPYCLNSKAEKNEEESPTFPLNLPRLKSRVFWRLS